MNDMNARRASKKITEKAGSAFANMGRIIVATVFFAGAATEIASHVFDHGWFWWTQVQNVQSWFVKPDLRKITADKHSVQGACIRSEKRLAERRCDEREQPVDRYLCRLEIPRAEPVCTEFAPPG